MEKCELIKGCKYYRNRLRTICSYIDCYLSIDEDDTDFLHILLEDDNYLDNHITSCLGDFIQHPERERSKIGKLICEEYLNLTIPERRLLHYVDYDIPLCKPCEERKDCRFCPIEMGGFLDEEIDFGESV